MTLLTEDFPATDNSLWELSSPGEATKAVGQAASLLAVPPSSQRCGDPTSQLPQWISIVGEKVPCAMALLPEDFPATDNPLWELSSPGEATKAVGQVASV